MVFTKTLAKSEWDNTLLAKGDIIDELHLFINPTAIGNGMPIFKELDSIQNFRLLKSTSFECGIVVLNYEMKK